MATFKFIYEGKVSSGSIFDEDSKKTMTVELQDGDLTVNELLEEFMNFLQGAGYRFNADERLEVVSEQFKPVLSSEQPAEVAVPAPVSTNTEELKIPTDEELVKEVDRIRPTAMGLSEEALEMIAYRNLMSKSE
jgi:hypothetical protein